MLSVLVNCWSLRLFQGTGMWWFILLLPLSYQIAPYKTSQRTILNQRCSRDPCQASLHTDMLVWAQRRRQDFSTKKRVSGGRRREMDVGRRWLKFFHAINQIHYTVAISIPQIFLLASCLSILASPVAWTLWSSTDIRAEALPTCNAPLEILLFSTLLHNLQPPLWRRSYGYMKQDQFFSLSVLPMQMLEKLENFRNIPVFIDMKY